ncbi:MAG: hypothetical protein ABFS16_16425 [Bacteroidota bacterium]
MQKRYTFIILLIVIFQSCATPKYFHDQSSYERQKELRNCRTGNVFCDIGSAITSVFAAALLDTDVGFYPSEQRFKKMNLVNQSNDTMYVNMLTDVYWDENDYCDFMDMRIPPGLKCKVLVPVEANYNLYFSNTPESDDDEMLEIYTSSINKIALYPGLTAVNDSTYLNQ